MRNNCTPWGTADHVEPKGNDGIVFVSTPSHGGFYVPPAMLDRVPLAWRKASFNGEGMRGWFEEDCDWCIVVLAFPDLFNDSERNAAQSCFRSWIAPKLKGGEHVS